MTNEYSAQNLEELISKISQYGFAIMDDFLAESVTIELANEIEELHNKSQLQDAGTGRDSANSTKAINKALRGDLIYWLDEAEASPAQKSYFTHMEALRLRLNQQLYLGLFALESHLALYPAGAGYKKHIDRFKTVNDGKPIRQISSILYLNQHWQASYGGHLRIYKTAENDADYLDISPIGGRLVLFLSDTFYHEVLPATQDRISLTGWFLTR
jgi:SM-20-related protein